MNEKRAKGGKMSTVLWMNIPLMVLAFAALGRACHSGWSCAARTGTGSRRAAWSRPTWPAARLRSRRPWCAYRGPPATRAAPCGR